MTADKLEPGKPHVPRQPSSPVVLTGGAWIRDTRGILRWVKNNQSEGRTIELKGFGKPA